MGDGPDSGPVHAGERDRGRLRHRVADGIGMAGALPLDHLDPENAYGYSGHHGVDGILAAGRRAGGLTDA